MATLKSLVDETTNIKNELVECRDILKAKLISKNVEVSDNENRLSVLIDKVDSLGNYDDGKLWLYKDGNEFTDITGGIAVNYSPYLFKKDGNKIILQTTDSNRNNGGVVDSSNTKSSGVMLKNRIDFSKYNKLFIEVEGIDTTTTYGYDNCFVSIREQIEYLNKPEVAGFRVIGTDKHSQLNTSFVKGIYELNIQNVKGSYYLHVVSSFGMNISIYKIWLEK